MHREMGRESDDTLRVVSYNIRRCLGVDGSREPSRIAAILKQLDFDVAGLLEVESGDPGQSPSRQLAELARLTQSHAVAGATILDPTGDYGNGLLLREPPSKIVRHDLSVHSFEPRGALEVTAQTRAGRLRIVVTHLGLGISERRAQLHKLLRILAESSPLPVLALGDFNEWFPWARGRRRLVEHFGAIPLPKTFPARFPLFALDHVWVQPHHLLLSLSAVSTPLTRVASDHLPVLARVRLSNREHQDTHRSTL
jgi:endonuclease/exonuclease/phosphatase family metal-dependent hydrolase